MQIWLYRAFFVVLQLISTHQAMRRHLLFLAVLLGLLTTVRAQDNDALNALKGNLIDPVPGYVKPFSHLDISLTTGSTGLGFDVSMPINNVFSLRTGYAFMPHVKHMMHFGVDVGDDPAESQSKFDRLSGMLAQFTGMEVDNIIDVEGQPTYWNWKLLVDVKPFRNKNWHLTAGIFLGSHEIARAKNTTEDMPSLMAVNIYNNLFTRSMNGELFTFGDIFHRFSEIRRKSLLKEAKVSCIDTDDRNFRKTALVYKTEECSVTTYAGEKILTTCKFIYNFIAEFLYQRNEFTICCSRSVLLITEHVYLHFALSVCYNNLSEYGI